MLVREGEDYSIYLISKGDFIPLWNPFAVSQGWVCPWGDVRTSQVALRATYSVEFRIRETRGTIKTYAS